MVINASIIKELEINCRRLLSDELKRYLLAKYKHEPFPYEYSKQDLYTNITNDIRDYEAGNLDVTVKTLSERWMEEREYLQSLYVEKCHEVHNLREYINRLEFIISENGLKYFGIGDKEINL